MVEYDLDMVYIFEMLFSLTILPVFSLPLAQPPPPKKVKFGRICKKLITGNTASMGILSNNLINEFSIQSSAAVILKQIKIFMMIYLIKALL